eukprot:TRINITY_DN7064_c0_g1_i2.p1 TRINITY_DN7064_c0_g1~~TRINITY_DN7064_c0_g1_i2.p1  ORF type:complete len:404 (-),score=67.85 TRINITY_DN7064_c0_g1_i2:228-1439(-)
MKAEKCVLLFCLLCVCCIDSLRLDIPLVINEDVNVTINPCLPDIPYVTKLTHSTYELRWLDNNPSVILYPILDGQLEYENCVIIDFQTWTEKGAFQGSTCPIFQDILVSGPYKFLCPDEITPHHSLKDLTWTYTKSDTNLTWITTFDTGAQLDVFFEIILEDKTKPFNNSDHTATRTLQFLKDSFEFSFVLKNYTLQYPYPENLEGDYYMFEVDVAILLIEPVYVTDLRPLLNLTLALYPNITGSSPEVPSYSFLLGKNDSTFNTTLSVATFIISDPITASTMIDTPGWLGFDPPYSQPGNLLYRNGNIVGQAALLGFPMSINESQSIYYDPNISLLLSKSGRNNDDDSTDTDDVGEEASVGLIVGLTIGLFSGALFVVFIVAVVIVVVVVKMKKHPNALVSL